MRCAWFGHSSMNSFGCASAKARAVSNCFPNSDWHCHVNNLSFFLLFAGAAGAGDGAGAGRLTERPRRMYGAGSV
jgi:hypothetical protein